MPLKLHILEEADREWTDAARWYEEQKTGLGERFIQKVEEKITLITSFPQRYPKRRGNFREALVNVFPYIIIYTFYEKEELITISSIFHASRDPKRRYRNTLR